VQIAKTDSLPTICSILIVQDKDADFAQIKTGLISAQSSKQNLERSTSLADALRRLRRGGIDIILLELTLPGTKGIDAIQKICLAAPDIPIIAMSESAAIETALEALKYGAEDYIQIGITDKSTLFRSIKFALARHAARATNDGLASIVNASPDAIISETLKGTITSWNHGAADLFGYSTEEATGKSMSLIIPEENAGEQKNILKAVENGETIRSRETVRLNKEGERIDVSSTISPILKADGTVAGAAAVDHDITARKTAQKVHQQSEELYHILVAGVKEYAIFTLDSDGIVQTWNEGAKRLKGYVATEIIGKHYSVFYGADDQELKLPEAQLKNAITHGSDEDQGWRKRKDGSSFLADVVITPLFSATGELRGFTNITRDITDRKLAENEIADSRLRLSLALEAAAVGVWDFDLAKNTVWRSLKHDEIFGHHQQLQEWNFATFLAYVLPMDRSLAKEAFKLAIEKGQLRLQCRIIRANDKAVRWIAVRGETVWNKEGGATRLLGTIADITEVKEQHEQQRLLAIMQEREDFMATLTHDMKNPLIGANRLLELFVAGGLGDLTNQQKELLQCLKDSNASLLKLIANLIDIYRLDKDTNELFIQNCDLVNIVNCCLSRTLPLAKLRAISIKTELPPSMIVRADTSSIERVVQNLLDNALKFAPDSGAIKVRLVSTDPNTILEIEDNGPGIAPEEQSLLFKRFYQGAAGKRYTGGSGLGLYLCKQIVVAHSGSIECQSKPGQTTVFRVSLPTQNPKTQQEARLCHQA